MKQFLLIPATLIFLSCHSRDNIENSDLKSERVSKTSTIQLNANIEKVFPLFGAFEERKWADKWDPKLIYPSTEIIEEGTTFKTHGHGHHEKGFLWIVSKYQPQDHLIQYLVSTENRFWTITVNCKATSADVTSVQITYSYTSLNNTGKEINTMMLKAIYHQDLKDWEKAINYYLETGKTLAEE